ncbi:MAG: tetratricopeptide repeat protein [Pseudomonadales bacterium]|nr:tetratricopeptide repeat protein [Pseudomonadales bacterium]
MHQSQDEFELFYTIGHSDSIAQFNAIIELYLGSNNQFMPRLVTLINTDAAMPMAHCFKAYSLLLAADPRFKSSIQEAMTQLSQLALNPREQLHQQAIHAWMRDRTDECIVILNDISSLYAKDIIALRMLHHLHFYAGDSRDIRNSLVHAIDIWRPEQRFYGYLLGMYSFGLEEAGDYKLAERLGREAIDLNPTDIWSAHAITHVMQMTQRYSEGIAIIKQLSSGWQQANNFAYHMQWHLALFYLSEDNIKAALEVYDSQLAGAIQDDFYLDICNATSLLWRLEMQGIVVTSRWIQLEQYANHRTEDGALVFSSLHYLMIPARLQQLTRIEAALAHFKAWSKADTSQGKVCREVGLALADAIIQLGRQEFRQASNTILSVEANIIKIGGSHAQRHLFTEMLFFAQAQSKI